MSSYTVLIRSANHGDSLPDAFFQYFEQPVIYGNYTHLDAAIRVFNNLEKLFPIEYKIVELLEVSSGIMESGYVTLGKKIIEKSMVHFIVINLALNWQITD